MTVLNKSQVTKPVLPKETVEVPELGGDVVVHGLLLRDRLEMFSTQEVDYGDFSKMLAATVMDADGEPVFSQEDWEIFGATNFSAAMKLFDVASGLSGLKAGENKKK